MIPGTLGTQAEDRSSRDRLLEAYQPFVQADLGRGHLLRLSQRRLEWIPGHRKPMFIPVAELRFFCLAERPIWEALVLGVPLMAGAALARFWVLRLIFAALFLLAVAACFAQKRYALRLRLRSDELVEIPLGFGTARSAHALRVQSVWATLSEELRGLGVTPADAQAQSGKVENR